PAGNGQSTTTIPPVPPFVEPPLPPTPEPPKPPVPPSRLPPIPAPAVPALPPEVPPADVPPLPDEVNSPPPHAARTVRLGTVSKTSHRMGSKYHPDGFKARNPVLLEPQLSQFEGRRGTRRHSQEPRPAVTVEG